MARKAFFTPAETDDPSKSVDPASPVKPKRRPPIANGGATAPHYIANAIKSQEGRTYQDIPVERISASAISDRLDVTEDIASLMGSIEANGQQVPIVVRIVEGENPYEIVVGRRRLEAMRRLGRKTIRGFVSRMTDRDAFIAQGIENNGRLETSYIEKARAVSLARDAGIEQTEIGQFLATSAPNISVMERIYRGLGEEIVQAIGPARGVGRRKWDAAEKVAAALRSLGEEPTSFVDSGVEDSVERFEAFVSRGEAALEPSSPAPAAAAPRGVKPERRKHLDGRLASLRKPGQLTLKATGPLDERFLTFLEERLHALHEEFENEPDVED
ncbi:ParB/RepB/Spo0J family partition protein [uncultured Jannaschia sp.]|uniref:ParB/RepB/Spo0J family partition protein n=1 Tax=uncultured Jannaschia sp. TaxID=293347 RepID=UPI002628942F|nr:ParB/RepB/Spo0J family partition protein [uncultured Jannaschia sp.]